MTRFRKALFTCSIATAIVYIAALTPTPAAAASVSKADKAALKRAIAACKAEAKGKKIKWLSRRKYVNQCVAAALKEHPSIDVTRMLSEHP